VGNINLSLENTCGDAFLNASLRNYFVNFITILNYNDGGTASNIQ